MLSNLTEFGDRSQIHAWTPEVSSDPLSHPPLPSMSMSEKCFCLGLAVAASAIALAVVRRQWGSKRPPYPPGPKGYPIIGNVFDLPKNPVWEGLTKMAQEYGEQ